jgi:hypothetical protein
MSTHEPRDIDTPTVTYRWDVYNQVSNMTVTPKRPGYTEHEIQLHPSCVEVEVSPGGDIEVSITGQYVSPEKRLSRHNTTIYYRSVETDRVYSFEALPGWARSLTQGLIDTSDRPSCGLERI